MPKVISKDLETIILKEVGALKQEVGAWIGKKKTKVIKYNFNFNYKFIVKIPKVWTILKKSKGRQKQDGAGTMVLKLKESSQIIKNIKI